MSVHVGVSSEFVDSLAWRLLLSTVFMKGSFMNGVFMNGVFMKGVFMKGVFMNVCAHA